MDMNSLLYSLATAILLMGCNGINTKSTVTNDTLPALPDTLQMGQSKLSRDTIPADTLLVLTADQRTALAQQTGFDIPDSTALIGVLDINGGCTLEAYKIPLSENPNDFKVYFVTRNNEEQVIDAIDLREFHTIEYQGRPRFGGNRFYTRDVIITFHGDRRFTQHVTMTLTGLYLKDHHLTELWRVMWDNRYEITADGHFKFLGQTETYRPDNLDDPIIEKYKSFNQLP